ncbi:hypothetical protein WG66_008515 [Moniliophthora roreri]|nr:hypothetical protein WG66_008515 [Moniliophthora roreri]
MAFSSEVERQRYSQQLAEYTLRQFSAARISMDNDELAAAKLPASHRHNYIKYARSLASNIAAAQQIIRSQHGKLYGHERFFAVVP